MIASHQKGCSLGSLMAGSLALCPVLSGGSAMAAAIEVLHADSPAGPMKALKAALATRTPGRRVNMTADRSREPAVALRFVRFIVSEEGRKILEAPGQPPLLPPITKGEIPRDLK